MYWDGEKQTYIPAATDQSNTEGAPMSTAPSDSLFASPGSKEKKDKPKNKTAQQVLHLLDTSSSADKCAKLSFSMNNLTPQLFENVHVIKVVFIEGLVRWIALHRAGIDFTHLHSTTFQNC